MSKRAIYFKLNEFNYYFDFGTYALLMYYIKQLNEDKARKLFDTMLSEFSYRANHDLSTDDITDEYISHFVINNIQESILFIDTKVIPSLRSESEDILSIYGGREQFYNFFYNGRSFLEIIGLEEDDFIESDRDQLIFLINRFKNFLKDILSVNQAYTVHIY